MHTIRKPKTQWGSFNRRNSPLSTPSVDRDLIVSG